MNPFEKHIMELRNTAPVKPEWIKRAIRNGRRRERRLAAKLGITREEARERLAHEMDLKQQGDD